MVSLHDVYQALGDPTRFEIIERLGARGPQTTLALLEGLGMSRQAGTKHLVVLENVGLIESRISGRQVVRELRMEVLDEAVDWLRVRKLAWNQNLDALKALVEDP